MSSLCQLRRIYTNVLFSTEKTLKLNSNFRLDLSKYRISNMNEKELINNLEEMTNILKNPEYSYLKKFKYKL